MYIVQNVHTSYLTVKLRYNNICFWSVDDLNWSYSFVKALIEQIIIKQDKNSKLYEADTLGLCRSLKIQNKLWRNWINQ